MNTFYKLDTWKTLRKKTIIVNKTNRLYVQIKETLKGYNHIFRAYVVLIIFFVYKSISFKNLKTAKFVNKLAKLLTL